VLGRICVPRRIDPHSDVGERVALARKVRTPQGHGHHPASARRQGIRTAAGDANLPACPISRDGIPPGNDQGGDAIRRQPRSDPRQVEPVRGLVEVTAGATHFPISRMNPRIDALSCGRIALSPTSPACAGRGRRRAQPWRGGDATVPRPATEGGEGQGEDSSRRGAPGRIHGPPAVPLRQGAFAAPHGQSTAAGLLSGFWSSS
jgi:hypothetical protein